MLQNAYAKMQRKERKGQLQDIKELEEDNDRKKGEHSFPYANSMKIE